MMLTKTISFTSTHT